MNKNFMVDKNLIKKICDYADLSVNDVVLEIGAGTGNLTEELSKRCKVIAIERDKNLVNFLINKFKNKNVEIIEGDALKISFPEFNKIVSNLPYSISRKITEKIFTHKFDLAVLVYQKEFGQKLVAKPKTKKYKAISVIAQTGGNIEILNHIERKAFSPVPDVDSVIVKITQKFPVEYEFIKFVKDAFSKRNKALFCKKRIYEMTPAEIYSFYKNLLYK